MSDQSNSTIRPPSNIRQYNPSPAPLTPQSIDRLSSSVPFGSDLQPRSAPNTTSSHSPRSSKAVSERSEAQSSRNKQGKPDEQRSQPRSESSRSERSTNRLPVQNNLDSGASRFIPATEQTSSPPKSKLASLASLRNKASKTKTQSETSGSYVGTESTATYPVLRPTVGSLSSAPTSLPDLNVQLQVDHNATRVISSTNPDLLKAKTRMTRATREVVNSAPGSESAERPTAPTPGRPHPVGINATQPSAPASTAPSSTKQSKLALLAQTKSSDVPPKVKRPKVLGPPYAHTQYLAPTSNSSAMTTAITTYVQTPDNMLSFSRADLPPAYPPTLPVSGRPAASSGKLSKLALKAKKVHTDTISGSNDQLKLSPESHPAYITDPIYGKNLRDSGASPSSFGSLLVDERNKRSRNKGDSNRDSDSEGRKQRRQRKEALLPAHLLSSPSVRSPHIFSFDVPSPDDIVMSARQGTALNSSRNSLAHSSKATSARTSPVSINHLP